MDSVRRQFFATAWILFALARSAIGGEFSHPRGFSFTYPDKWVVVNPADMSDPRVGLPKEVRSWMTDNKIELSSVAVVLLRDDGNHEFMANLNVVIDEEQQIPVNESVVEQMITLLPKQFKSMGVKFSSLKVQIEKVGGRDAIVAEYYTEKGRFSTLRQKQALIPGGGKTYVVSCTAMTNSYEQYQPAFDEVLASFKVPELAAPRFVISRTLMYSLIGGLAAGLVGGLVWIIKKSLDNEDARRRSRQEGVTFDWNEPAPRSPDEPTV